MVKLAFKSTDLDRWQSEFVQVGVMMQSKNNNKKSTHNIKI